MATYTKPRRRKKEESERLRGEGDQIRFNDLRFERWQVVGFRKQEEGNIFHKLHILGMNDDLWGRVRGLGSETWKGCDHNIRGSCFETEPIKSNKILFVTSSCSFPIWG